MIGRQVGNYQVTGQIGEDGLGYLYAGRHVAGGWNAALRHFLAPISDVPIVQRYFSIAQRAGQVGNSGLVNAVECFWSGRNAFVATEALGGESMDTILKRDRRLWPELVVKLGWQVANALTAAHSASVVHGILRPQSLFCWPDPELPGGYRVKIIDFGASVFLDVGAPDWRSPRVECVGLPLYMAPEQGRSGFCDYRVDVYALGCIFYQMSSGRTPFLGATAQEIVQAHVAGAIRGPMTYERDIPPELDQLIVAMIAKDPGQRPLMPQVAAELTRICDKYWPAVRPSQAMSTVQLDLKVGAPPPPMVAQKKRGHGVIIGAAIGVVALGTGVALWHPWKKSGEVAEAAVAIAADAGSKVAVPPPPESAPASAPAPVPAVAPASLPASEPAITDKDLKQNKPLYDDFEKALKDGDDVDVAKAVRRYHRIPEDSAFAKKARPDYEKLRGDYLHVKSAEAKALADTGKCAKIDPIAKDVGTLFPESAGEISAIQKSCTK